MTAWTCPDCEGASIGDLRRAGLYVEPNDPGAECATCGSRPSEAVRTRLLLAQIRDRLALAQPAAPVVVPARPADTSGPAPRRPTVAGLLSARAASARLGVNRSTLARLHAQGALVSVPKGGRRGYRTADVEALIERGFKLDGPAPRPPPKTRRRSRKNGTADPSVEARLAEF